jgi:hypothetical protein
MYAVWLTDCTELLVFVMHVRGISTNKAVSVKYYITQISTFVGADTKISYTDKKN